MKIDNIWPEFSIYLYSELGLSTKSHNKSCDRSRFNTLVKLLNGRDFTRENITLVFHAMGNGSPNSKNNLLKTAFKVDMFLYLRYKKPLELMGYKYFKVPVKVDFDTVTFRETMALAQCPMPYNKGRAWLNRRQKALILTMYHLGARAGSEVINLTWDKLRNDPFPYVLITDTKTGRDRQMPIRKSLYDLLCKLPKKNEFIFPSYRGGRLSLSEVNYDLAKRTERINLCKTITTKTFRRSKYTRMANSKTPIFDLAILMGASDPKAILPYYQRSLNTLLRTSQYDPAWGQMPFDERVRRLEEFALTLFPRANISKDLRNKRFIFDTSSR